MWLWKEGLPQALAGRQGMCCSLECCRQLQGQEGRNKLRIGSKGL